MVFGVIEIFRHGAALQGWLYTYLPIAGGLASCICASVYMDTMKAPEGRSWAKTFGALAGFVPYFFCLYLLIILGLWAVFRALSHSPLAWGHIALGALWVTVAWRMLSGLGQFKRLSSQAA
jgi:uncharacterized BrkB/YihY/UPF0761 family membrane protein